MFHDVAQQSGVLDLDDMVLTSCGSIRVLDEHHREDGHGCETEGKSQFCPTYGERGNIRSTSFRHKLLTSPECRFVRTSQQNLQMFLRLTSRFQGLRSL